MKYTKRALMSIKRRKNSSLILLAIVFILANVLITTLAITNSIDNTKKAVLSNIKPTVNLEVDYGKITEEMTFEEFPTITPEMVDKIVEINREFIESYDYVRFFSAKSSELEPVVFPGIDQGVGSTEAEREIPISLNGTQTEFSKEVAMGEAGFIKGQGLSKDDHDQGANKVMVSKEFAELNNLDIGSVFSLRFDVTDYDQMSPSGLPKVISSFNEEVTVVGIIDFKSVQEVKAMNGTEVDYNKWYEADSNANALIVPNSFIGHLNKKMIDIYVNAGIDPVASGFTTESVNPTFILNDYQYLAQFLKNGESVIDKEVFNFVSTEDQYNLVAQPLESVGSLLGLILVITIVASVVILSLILSIFIYFRQKEIGIYLALGERKSRIIGQLLIETLTIAIIAATLAIFTGMLFTSLISDSMIANLVSSPPDMGGGMSSLGSTSINTDLISMQYNSTFSVSLIVIFYSALISTVVFAQMITVLYLLRLNPKKILM